MATTVSERRSRVVEALGFWFITLVICAAAGLGSYRFGRQWIGDRLGGDVKSVLTSEELASRVSDEALSGGDPGQGADVPDEPPAKAVVEVAPTTVSVQDQQKLRFQNERERRDSGSRDSGPERSDVEDEDEAEADVDKDRTERSSEGGRTERPVARPVAPPAARPDRQPEKQPAKQPEKQPEAVGESEHVVRAGSFTKADNAERLVEELRSKGYQPFVTETVVDGVRYRRVNVARYNDRDKAFDLRRELRADGYPAEISSE